MKVDSAVIDFPCPNCARYINQSIGEIRTNKAITCSCGQKVLIDEQELKAAIKVMRKTLRKVDAEQPCEPMVLFAPDELERNLDQFLFRKPS